MYHQAYWPGFPVYLCLLFCYHLNFSRYEDFYPVPASVDLSDMIRAWDGFGMIDLRGTEFERSSMIRSIDNKKTDRDPGIVRQEIGFFECEVPPRSVRTITGIK